MASDESSSKIAAGWVGNATTSGYIAVQGSSTYTLSGYIYILYHHSGNIYLDLNDGNAQGQNITDVNIQADTSKIGVWQRVAGTFTTAPATTGVKVRVVYDGAQTDMSVVFYADEISITPGTTPPAAAWTYDYRDPSAPGASFGIGIANPGFESGSGTNAYSWSQFGTSRTTARAHSGSASLLVDHAVGSVLNATTASYIAVEGSTSYWLSAWVYVQSSSGGNLYLDLDDGHGQGEDFNDVTIAANTSLVGSWQHITGMFQTAPGTTGVKVRVVHGSAASVVAYVDDITLEKEMGDREAPQNGMIQQIRDQVNPSYSETYSYDNLYRLVHADASVWTAE
ncbi:MAG: carbohydrate binding domain-containing protein, partial [Acidobacteriota bacterium]